MNLASSIPSKCAQLEKDVTSDPWNYKAWNALLFEASQNPTADGEYVSKVFEKALEYFPSFVSLYVCSFDFNCLCRCVFLFM